MKMPAARRVPSTSRRWTRALPALALLFALPARAQYVPGLERRLVDIHALLLDLPRIEAPGALAPGQVDASLEVAAIPPINGDVGPKRDLTASDHARLFPRPRLAIGLPGPPGFRAFVGAAYIPPIEINRVTVNSVAVEAGLAWLHGPLRLELRGHGVWARALSPVSAPYVRDRLDVADGGWDLAAGWELRARNLSLTPYAVAGQVWTRGDFRSSVDGGTVHSQRISAALAAGARLLFRDHWEGVVEYSAYPGRVWGPRFRLGYVAHLPW